MDTKVTARVTLVNWMWMAMKQNPINHWKSKKYSKKCKKAAAIETPSAFSLTKQFGVSDWLLHLLFFLCCALHIFILCCCCLYIFNLNASYLCFTRKQYWKPKEYQNRNRGLSGGTIFILSLPALEGWFALMSSAPYELRHCRWSIHIGRDVLLTRGVGMHPKI